jgi:hypothetical protein
LDDAPDFFVRQLIAESNHAGTDRSMLDHPEDFAFRTMTPESVVLEIARRWIQLGSQWPIAAPVFPMTVETAALAVIEVFAVHDGLRGIRQRTRERTCFRQFLRRNHLLHHMPFGSPGWDGKKSYCSYQWESGRLHHMTPLIVYCGD